MALIEPYKDTVLYLQSSPATAILEIATVARHRFESCIKLEADDGPSVSQEPANLFLQFIQPLHLQQARH